MDSSSSYNVPRQPGTFYFLSIVVSLAVLLATVFSLLPPNARPEETDEEIFPTFEAEAQTTPGDTAPTAIPALRIGIVSGHWSKDPALYDPGAVCPNGTTEADINLAVATKVRDQLLKLGYQVDVLEEFDNRLNGYQASALVSIHADSCVYINEEATGFKVSPPLSNPHPENSSRLVSCMINRYSQASGLPQHKGSITRDMTNYHAFAEINSETPAAIIETGFLNLDYNVLTQNQDQMADGISDGILCFLRNESPTSQSTPVSTPVSTNTPYP